ncbi:hypothetical protein BDZ94DRAFT_1251296 [Collybia nuda]|uniref:Uncharacterized protein n=1 Tax=Collybia nuda TaxID=64659 RepID=A0A9P5YCZ9_9AGAR|nr:hypothetical protein BDZ94DRAFT_1251296 [Collybia nuda]
MEKYLLLGLQRRVGLAMVMRESMTKTMLCCARVDFCEDDATILRGFRTTDHELVTYDDDKDKTITMRLTFFLCDTFVLMLYLYYTCYFVPYFVLLYDTLNELQMIINYT